MLTEKSCCVGENRLRTTVKVLNYKKNIFDKKNTKKVIYIQK